MTESIPLILSTVPKLSPPMLSRMSNTKSYQGFRSHQLFIINIFIRVAPRMKETLLVKNQLCLLGIREKQTTISSLEDLKFYFCKEAPNTAVSDEVGVKFLGSNGNRTVISHNLTVVQAYPCNRLETCHSPPHFFLRTQTIRGLIRCFFSCQLVTSTLEVDVFVDR